LYKKEKIMAYILYDSLGDAMRGGPFPHKAGEYCGNVLCRDVVVAMDGSVTVVNRGVLSALRLPFGDTSSKLKAGEPADAGGRFPHGCVGLYLAEDHMLEDDAVEIDTDIFAEEVVSGKRLPQKPVDGGRIRRKEL
jgi:hypothetical protein